MMDFNFLKPVENDVLQFIKTLSTHQLGANVLFHTNDEFPKIEETQIAIVGVLDSRGGILLTENLSLQAVRRQLYALFVGNWSFTIADLGDIAAGNTVSDTQFVLHSLVADLVKKKVVPIVIGGSQDLTYALYRAYDKLEQMVNLVAVDKKFDFGKETDALTANSYLTKIILTEPNNLFNFCNLGYQTYYNSQEEIDLVEKLFFESYRLGELCTNISLAEPVFRDADIVSLDLSSVKSADSGNTIEFIPNGFNGKEICTLARYSGISDKVSVFGVFNHNYTTQESVLIAQIIWYFIEGYHCRSAEYPFGTREHYVKYIVPLDEEVVFYKSNKTERWWIEIPFLSNLNNKLKKSTLLPCSHEEYLQACNQEIPDRWWKAVRRNLL